MTINQNNEGLKNYHTVDFLRLQRLLARHQGFQLILAEYNAPVYVDQLIAKLHKPDLPAVEWYPDKTLDVRLLIETLANPEKNPQSIHLRGLSEWPEQQPEFFVGLNYARERIAESFPNDLIVWLASAELRRFHHYAADLWAWRSAIFNFSLRPVPGLAVPGESAVERRDRPENLHVKHKLARLERLKAFLKDSDSGDHLSLWVEASRIQISTGDIDGALLSAATALEELAKEDDNKPGEAVVLGLKADILQARGELDEALRIRREEEMPMYERLGEVRSIAITTGKIADILQVRGELDEALRIRREDESPVYERLGDMRSVAITKGKIADILQSRGELDEALRIRRDDELPVYERLCEVRAIAITKGKIADILHARGELDEVLRIRMEDELPVYERLGDVRLIAVIKGKIADILYARGELDDALRIRREDELPVYERLGEVLSIAITKAKIADILEARGELDEALRIRKEDQLPVYERLGEVREIAITKGKIADILAARGELDEALRLRREQLPVLDKLKDRRGLSVAKAKLAMTILAKQTVSTEEQKESEDLLLLALGSVAAMRLRQETMQVLNMLVESQVSIVERLAELEPVALEFVREVKESESTETGRWPEEL